MNSLFDNNIYTCSLHNFLPVEKNRFFLLYAPLSTIATIATGEDLEKMKHLLTGKNTDEPLKEVVSALLDTSPSEEALSKRIRKTSDFINISLLLNNICNFDCSYCYSASSRSNVEIDENKLIAALDYFINRKRTGTNQLSLSFLGGGEPMISKKLIKKAVDHANRLADREGFDLWFKIVSNGSLIQAEDIDFILKNNIELVISYDILEDIQNLQRKHFDTVSQKIKMLVENGAPLSINTVITPHSVHRQCEMIEDITCRFPQIDYLSFEPLMELNDWSSRNIDTIFYDDFIANFIPAHELAEKHDIELSCSLLRNVDCSVERYCAGEFAVCPDGSITVCPCVSSPEMQHYKNYVYGQIHPTGEIDIDEHKLAELLAEDVHNHPECKDCFAKWNCGGGCIHTNKSDDRTRKKAKCDFIRNFTKKIIWNRTKLDYENGTGKPIMEILNGANT